MASKDETQTQLTYTLDDGVVYTIQKDDSCIDIHIVIPILNAAGQTWQNLRDQLDSKVNP